VRHIVSEVSATRARDALYIQQLLAWGFRISSTGFEGPFLAFPRGQELAVLRSVFAALAPGPDRDPEALLTIYCSLES
jgi:hypothetical protein